MKFGKKVLYELQQFPVDVQQHCLDYRHWKKRAHEPRLITAVSWKLRLARECSRIDRFLNERKGAMDQETLDRIAVLNTDILYKARWCWHFTRRAAEVLCFCRSPATIARVSRF